MIDSGISYSFLQLNAYEKTGETAFITGDNAEAVPDADKSSSGGTHLLGFDISLLSHGP